MTEQSEYQRELTDRQLQILTTYLEEGSARATARKLSLSEQTVKNTLHTVRRKTGTHTTLQAVYKLLVNQDIKLQVQ